MGRNKKEKQQLNYLKGRRKEVREETCYMVEMFSPTNKLLLQLSRARYKKYCFKPANIFLHGVPAAFNEVS